MKPALSFRIFKTKERAGERTITNCTIRSVVMQLLIPPMAGFAICKQIAKKSNYIMEGLYAFFSHNVNNGVISI